jgi:formylmethanofuran dehydrogenase subunit B
MSDAWIAGKPAALDSAVAEAAKLLAASRHPLIAGLGTDVAGARAAIALGERIGAVIDHMNSDAVLRDLDVMRSSGVMLTTPTEAHVRADTLLIAGPGLGATAGELRQRLFDRMPESQGRIGAERRIYWLCPGGDWAKLSAGGTSARAVGKEPKDLPTLVAALRARLAGRATGKLSIAAKVLDEISAGLKAARFGVAVWSAAALDALAIEMLCGLVNDLNAATRFSALPLSPADNAIGVLHACGWMTGMPMRTGFGRELPQHDPWLFDGRRLAGSGEADCVIWISAYRAAAPGWDDGQPTIALTGRDAGFGTPPNVHIAVGRPGVDHAGVQHLASTGTLAAVGATQPSAMISVAEAIARIAAALPGEPPC